jgi:hypothetical protein
LEKLEEHLAMLTACNKDQQEAIAVNAVKWWPVNHHVPWESLRLT